MGTLLHNFGLQASRFITEVGPYWYWGQQIWDDPLTTSKASWLEATQLLHGSGNLGKLRYILVFLTMVVTLWVEDHQAFVNGDGQHQVDYVSCLTVGSLQQKEASRTLQHSCPAVTCG